MQLPYPTIFLIFVSLFTPIFSFANSGKYSPSHFLDLLGATNFFVRTNETVTRPKIAFMFLTDRGLFHKELWEKFFEDANPAAFSLYASVEQASVATVTQGNFLKNQIVNILPHAPMDFDKHMASTTSFYRKAFEDPSNLLFIIIDESGIPLKPFWFMYRQLMYSTNKARNVVNDASFSKGINPIYTQFCSIGFLAVDVLKHHQWTIVNREDIELMVRFGFPASNNFRVRNFETKEYAPVTEWLVASSLANAVKQLEQNLYGFSISSRISLDENCPLDSPARKRRFPRESFWKRINNGNIKPSFKNEYPGQCATHVCWDNECGEIGKRDKDENPRLFLSIYEEEIKNLVRNPVHLFSIRYHKDAYVTDKFDAEKEEAINDKNSKYRLFNSLPKIMQEIYDQPIAMPDGFVAHRVKNAF